MAWRIGISQTHKDHDLATWVTGTGGPPLATIDHPLITFTTSIGLHIGCIGRSNTWLGHTEAGANLTRQQRLYPALFLLFVTVANDGFHITGIRRAAVECLRRQTGPAHQLSQWRIFEVGQTSTQLGFGQEQVPQARGPRLDFQFFHDGGRLPAIALGNLLVKDGLSRKNMLLHESVYTLAQIFNLGGISEIHIGCLCLLGIDDENAR